MKNFTSMFNTSKILLSFFLLTILTAFLKTSHAQQATIEVIVAGVDNPNEVEVNDTVSLRCRIVDENGDELNALSTGESTNELNLSLELDRGPENGFGGNIQGASAQGKVIKSGLYVFRCRAANQDLAQGLGNSPGVVNVSAASIQEVAINLRPAGNYRPGNTFEVDEKIRLQYKAFSDNDQQDLVRPSNSQILIREGYTTCDGNEEIVMDEFRTASSEDWSAEFGHVKRYVPKQTGKYTFVVNQADGSGLTKCDSAHFEVVSDARPPQVNIETPSEHFIHWEEETFPIRGTIIETGTENPEDLQVTVSNGHWSSDARVSDLPEDENEYFFNASLPWVPGLQIIEVTATDAAGIVGRDFFTAYAGNTHEGIAQEDPINARAYHSVVVQPGRDLVRNTQGPIDSFNEVIELAPLLLKAHGGVENPGHTYIDRYVNNPIRAGLKYAIVPDFESNGVIIPGDPEYKLFNQGDILQLAIRVPMDGSVNMDCQVLIPSAITCNDGEVNVSVGGYVDVTMDFEPTIAGGLGFETSLLNNPKIADYLAISNDARIDRVNNSINDNFRDNIISNIKEKVDELILSLWNCLDEDGNERSQCLPDAPFEGDSPESDPAWVRLFGGERTHNFSFEMDHPSPEVEQMDVTLPFTVARLGMANSRIDMTLSLGTFFQPISEGLGNPRLLLDYGGLEEDNVPIERPDILSLFGSGDHDIQGAVHLNTLNKTVAQLWASELQEIELPLERLIDNEVHSTVVSEILPNASIDIRLKAPPRVTYYDGAMQPYLEIGTMEIELDLEEDLNSKLLLEAGLKSELSIEEKTDGEGIKVSFEDPVGCQPNGRSFMNCKGRFDLGITKREGFNAPNLRQSLEQRISEAAISDFIDSDEILNTALATFGIVDDQGNERSEMELKEHYHDIIGSIVSDTLSENFALNVPNIPLPEIDFGEFQVAPLDITNINIHNRANGGRLSSGWIGFEFDLEGDI